MIPPPSSPPGLPTPYAGLGTPGPPGRPGGRNSITGRPTRRSRRGSGGPVGPAPAAAAAASGTEGFLARLGAQVWGELRKLVVLRKVESPEPPLLPPSQTYFLRQNLKLRLLNARLSLLMRDEAGYRGDLKAAQLWVRRYFDTHSKRVGDVLEQLRQLSSVSLDVEVPSIAESLDAVRSFKARGEGGGS